MFALNPLRIVKRQRSGFRGNLQRGLEQPPRRLGEIGVDFTDLETSTSTLEDIFVGLIGRAA